MIKVCPLSLGKSFQWDLAHNHRPANLSASNAWKMAKKMAEMLGKRVKCLETAVASPAAGVHNRVPYSLLIC